MITFLHGTTVGQPLFLCEDVRRHIHWLSQVRMCKRCNCVVSTGGSLDRVRICYTGDGITCFTCWHRMRWPRV